MIRQKNKGLSLIKTLYFVNLAKASMVLLFLFLIFSCFPPAPTVDNEATAATTYLFSSAQTAPTLSLTTDKSSISITANPTSTLATGKVTNTVSTTNYAGYKLTANLSGTSTNLTHSTISSKNIPSITSTYTSTNFPTGYWGVSLDDTNYQALPASNATALQLKNQTAAATNQTVALTVGTKVNQNQANGNYTNTINLTATANAASYTITYDKNTTDTVSNLPSAQTGTVSASAIALSSNTPTRTGYTFLGWSEDSTATAATFTNGASVYFSQTQDNTNIKLYAVWKINTYTVTLAVDNYGYGTLTKYSQTANHGSAVSINGSTVTIAGTTITAAPIDPTERFIYSFDGWTNDCGATITGDCTITARFTRVNRTYTVTFAVNTSGYGTVSRSSQSVTYESAVSISGATATVAGTATTATATTATAQYTYAFSNWTNGCGTTVTGNCTITANFTRSTRSYTVTFAVNTSGYGSLTRTSQASIPYGTAVSISGATTTINSVATTATATTATAQYSYAFSSWTNGCGATVTGNCTITANFTRSTRSYTVTFAMNPTSGYGSLTRTSQSVDYGSAVSVSGATVTISSTATTATASGMNAFTGWTNGCGSTVTGACTITAGFREATMQDIGSIKSQLASETQYQLKDSRDGKWYWVAKLKDGNIWMTQNLDYDISASSNTVSKTDGTTSTWGSSSTNAPKATSTSVVNSSNNADTYSYDYGNQYVPGGSGTATAATDLASSAAKGDTNLHYHLGNLYQWNAVTAGTGAGLATGSNATTSICPAGWRLPISGDYTSNYSFGKLTNAYGATSSTAGTTTANVNTMKAAPLYFAFAGNTDRGGPWSKGTIGYYWTSTVQSSGNTYRLTISPSAANKVAPNDFQSQFMGFSVRCVAI